SVVGHIASVVGHIASVVGHIASVVGPPLAARLMSQLTATERRGYSHLPLADICGSLLPN
ncbi:MAG: hypothetical protein WCN95_12835, partial [bacterium]